MAGAVSSFIYDPYGRFVQVGASNLDFRYAGMYYLEEAALNLTRYRAYDSVSARWLNRDPIAEDGGINLYGYVEGNPVNLIDPLGLQGQTQKYYIPSPWFNPLPIGSPQNKYWAKKLSDFCDEMFNESSSPAIDPKDVAGKSPGQIDKIAKDKGLIPKGDPETGNGAYIDPVTGKQRILTHPEPDRGCSGPHCHVNNPTGERLDINGNVVPTNSPDAHLPLNYP